jgi:hypothetical protein
MDALEGLDPLNRRAWRVFHRVCSQFAVDTHSSGVVLERATREDDPEAFEELLERLARIYRAYYPTKAGHGA